jgi:DeoR/GlpR family transcriptional regulator of sugar metabolism
MLKKERQQKITEILKTNGNIVVSEMQAVLNVSEMTIRRDLNELEASGTLKRVYGGAFISDSITEEPMFSERKVINLDYKTSIAQYAVTLIKSGLSIFLDGGSTCSILAEILPKDLDITVITNNLEVLTGLRNYSGIHLISLGGQLALDGNTFDGTLAVENAEMLSVDLCFFSGRGFSTTGISNKGLIGTMVKKAIIKNANRCYLLADSTKYNQSGVITLCKWDKVDMLITDSNLPIAAQELLKSNGVNIKLT